MNQRWCRQNQQALQSKPRINLDPPQGLDPLSAQHRPTEIHAPNPPLLGPAERPMLLQGLPRPSVPRFHLTEQTRIPSQKPSPRSSSIPESEQEDARSRRKRPLCPNQVIHSMPPFPAPKEPARRLCERATLPRSGDSLSGAPACIINRRKDGFQPQPVIQRISHLPRIAAACLIATALFITGCDHPSPAPDHVTLRLTTREPEPETRLEVEFDQAVVEHASLGIAAPSPLAIDPEVPGMFVWRSRRSGVFAPSEPFRLGQRYVVGLRPGLRDGSGKPVDAKLNRKLTLPGLRLEASPHEWWNRDDLPAVPVVSVTANAPLETAELAGRARFTDGHASIAAEVEANPDFPRHLKHGRPPGNTPDDVRRAGRLSLSAR